MVDYTNNPVEVKRIVHTDGTTFPICPSCGEIAYEYDRCLFCGQRFDKGSFPDEEERNTVKNSQGEKFTIQEK